MRIAADDPGRPDVQQLLERHLAFAFANSPREHVHALDTARLVHPSITFFSARDDDDVLLGVGALKEVDAAHGEVKSMHTARHARRAGVGRSLLLRIIEVAHDRGYATLSLETGTGPAFAPAQSMYIGAGFVVCEPFGEYTRNPHSTCMRLFLQQR